MTSTFPWKRSWIARCQATMWRGTKEALSTKAWLIFLIIIKICGRIENEMRKPRILLIVCVISLTVAGVFVWRKATETTTNPGQPKLRAAPGFKLKDAEGKEHRLEE